MADWPGAPEKLSTEDRRRFRDALAENLRLSALMENVVLLAAPDLHAKNLDRLRAVAELGHDLKPDGDAIIETVMGGQPSQWDDVRAAMVERLTDWAKIAEQTKSTIAIKAHISGAAHRPEHVRWLLDQVKSPSLKAAFDFSHFQLRGLSLKESWTICHCCKKATRVLRADSDVSCRLAITWRKLPAWGGRKTQARSLGHLP